jgi:pilus assembly protein CpaE
MVEARTTRTLVAVDADVRPELVQQSLPFEGEVEITGVVEGLDEAWRTLQETSVDLLVVACSGYSDRAVFLIENAVREDPSRPVIVLCQGSVNGFVRRVFEVGADDILGLPESPSTVYFAFTKALARKQGAAASIAGRTSPLVCVLGPKGGTGKTLTTSNLGVALAEAGKRVTVVDLDLQFGDLGLALGLTPDRTIFDLAKAGGSIDADKLSAFLVDHASGLRLLLAPSRPDQASAVTTAFLREVYSTLRATNDIVLVDTPPGFTPEVIASIDASTEVVIVGMLDSLSLKNTKLGLETLSLMGYDPSRIRIVLNRADSRVGITSEDVVAVMGREPDLFVPSDREIPRALNEGQAIVSARRNSEAAKAFRSLAQVYLDEAMPELNGAKPKPRGQRRRLIGRSA